ncbi:hypothetical protein [Variovorax sp. dw_308]|uniref:hypothetical protein n=2 Tax=unclassified Variovorax TaxID=663243 RepID=UPI001C457727|nr:hypothetical protein [Variovorax sp. dw_308]
MHDPPRPTTHEEGLMIYHYRIDVNDKQLIDHIQSAQKNIRVPWEIEPRFDPTGRFWVCSVRCSTDQQEASWELHCGDIKQRDFGPSGQPPVP